MTIPKTNTKGSLGDRIMIKIFSIKSELESAEQLGFETFLFNDSLFSENFKDDVVVRWGSSRLIYNNSTEYRHAEFPNVINRAKAIRFNCEKNLAMDILTKVVSTPRIFGRKVPEGKEAVVRFIEHSHGKDFQILKGPLALNEGQFATEFIKTDTEYRVWFCGGATFAAKRIALSEEDKSDFPCRSNWGYSYLREVPQELHNQTLFAAKEIGLSFGAADVLKHEGKYLFLELNSAPSIDTNRLKKFFKDNLVALVLKKFPNIKI
jgi:hypothetical protein